MWPWRPTATGRPNNKMLRAATVVGRPSPSQEPRRSASSARLRALRCPSLPASEFEATPAAAPVRVSARWTPRHVCVCVCVLRARRFVFDVLLFFALRHTATRRLAAR